MQIKKKLIHVYLRVCQTIYSLCNIRENQSAKGDTLDQFLERLKTEFGYPKGPRIPSISAHPTLEEAIETEQAAILQAMHNCGAVAIFPDCILLDTIPDEAALHALLALLEAQLIQPTKH